VAATEPSQITQVASYKWLPKPANMIRFDLSIHILETFRQVTTHIRIEPQKTAEKEEMNPFTKN